MLIFLLMPTQAPTVDLLAHLVFRFPFLKPNNLKVATAVKHQVLSRISLSGALRMVTRLWSPQGGESRERDQKFHPLHISECLFIFGHLQYSKGIHRLPHLPHSPIASRTRARNNILASHTGVQFTLAHCSYLCILCIASCLHNL